MSDRILKIEGHRGYLSEAYENSLEGFHKAFQENLDGIETDLWMTKDNVVIISHGINEEGLEMMWDPIKKKFVHMIITKDIFSNIAHLKYPDKKTSVLTLEKLLDDFGYQQKMYLNLEFKDKNLNLIKETIKMIKKKKVTADIQFCSFNQDHIDEVKSVCFQNEVPLIPFFLNIYEFHKIYDPELMEGLIQEKVNVTLGIDLILSERELLKNFVDKLKKQGGRVKSYNLMELDNMETDELFDFMVDFGVEAFCCNRPEVLKEYNVRRVNTENRM